MNGILCLDKPRGFTSFDAVAKLRGMSRTRRVGHAGTLDPMADGVLPLFFGTAAAACGILPNQDKIYLASLRLGLTTDTQDTSGTVIRTAPVQRSRDDVAAALERFRGDILQLPPMYSAVQVNGRRLYDLARQGIEVERSPRPVTIHRLELISGDEAAGEYVLRVHCSKGTYIRTLCHDLGETLGCGAALSALRREAACGFTLQDCVSIEQAQRLTDEGRLEEALLPVSAAFAALPRLELDPRQTRLFQNGVRLDRREFPPELTGRVSVCDQNSRFIGIADLDEENRILRHVRLFERI